MSVCRRLWLLLALVGIVVFEGRGVPTWAQDKAPAKSELKTQKDKASYAIGMSMGRDFKQLAVDISPDLIARGLRDALTGDKCLLTDQEAKDVLSQFQQEASDAMAERQKTEAERQQKEGAAFLAANGKKPGVTTTASGLQYKIIRAGTGKKPKADDIVTTHYRGTLVDGKVFDSSYDRKQPAVFPVNRVIPGWTEALQMMPEGSKWQLVVPANLAYGERGHPPVIAPNSTLLFDVELVAIGAPKQQDQEQVLPKVRLKK